MDHNKFDQIMDAVWNHTPWWEWLENIVHRVELFGHWLITAVTGKQWL